MRWKPLLVNELFYNDMFPIVNFEFISIAGEISAKFLGIIDQSGLCRNTEL